MELDRESIERSDFPQARRGYDPEAVDQHLARVARSAEDLREDIEAMRAAQAAPQPLSGAAAEQIRLIVEAAEQSAAGIETSARESAERQSREAEERARELVGVSQSHVEALVTRVDEAADQMRRRMDRLDSELTKLREGARGLITAIEGLGERSEPLREQVEELRAGVRELRDDPDAVLAGPLGRGGRGAERDEPDTLDEEPTDTFDAPRGRGRRGSGRNGVGSPEPRGAEEEVLPEATAEPSLMSDEERADEAELDREEALLEEELDREDELAGGSATPAVEDGPAASGGDDEEGARLVALNMALNGVPREETDRYLADNFALNNRSTVLDDVYARVGE